MIQRIPVLSKFSSLFNRRDPRREASLALARMLSQLDMKSLPFDEGIQPSRRDDGARHMAIGVWLVPVGETQSPNDANLAKAIPAATCDIRRHGIGVLMPVRLESARFIVAVADLENSWRFFLGTARHQSDRPGGWFQVGLAIDEIWDPTSLQIAQFRHRVETAFQQ